MNLNKYYIENIITPLELEIKTLKHKNNKKFSFNKEQNNKNLLFLQKLLFTYYQKFYLLNEKKN